MIRPSILLALLAACLTPPGIVRADTVYAVSFTTGELIGYDSANPSGTKSVLSGSGSLISPSALTIGPDGNLYIGEDGNGGAIAPRISKFDLATLTRSTIHSFAGFEVYPGSLAFKGSDLLVGRNSFYSNTGPIVKVANATGGPVSVTDYTTGGSLASSPGLAVATNGELFVSDQTYNFITGIASGPVKRFDAAGVYVGEVIASGSDGLAGPTGLAVSGSSLITASIMNGSVLQTDLVSGFTQAAPVVGPFEIGALALLADGNLLAGSPSGSGSIYRIDTATWTVVDTFPSGLGQIGGIAAVAVPEPTSLASALAALGVGWLMLRSRRT